MSDSSEDEDLSRFREAIDTSFVKLIQESRDKTVPCLNAHPPSERYLEVPSHYNDVRVPKEMQKTIGDKISAVIQNLVEYVDIKHQNVKQPKVKGGVKLFNDSEGFLSCKEAEDTYTEAHNRRAKNIKGTKRKHLFHQDDSEYSESDKMKSVVVTGEYVMSKEETRHWRSRRKEKVFTYKAIGKSRNILLAV